MADSIPSAPADAAGATPPSQWPFDEAGLRESVERAVGRLWVAEEDRRYQTGRPLHLFGIVTVALLTDERGEPCVGLGLDYIGAPGGDPRPLLAVVGQHLVRLAERKPDQGRGRG